jgi:hypothetical protein
MFVPDYFHVLLVIGAKFQSSRTGITVHEPLIAETGMIRVLLPKAYDLAAMRTRDLHVTRLLQDVPVVDATGSDQRASVQSTDVATPNRSLLVHLQECAGLRRVLEHQCTWSLVPD